MSGTEQGFPQLAQRFVDPQSGILQQPWYSFLLSMWNRTGGGEGIDNQSLAILTALAASAPPPSPPVVTPAWTPVVTSEALTARDMVNIWDSSGVKARRADATAAGKDARGYVLADFAMGATAKVYFSGFLDGLSGLTGGAAWLDTSPGQVTSTPPSGSGNIVQMVGTAVSATKIAFSPLTSVEL